MVRDGTRKKKNDIDACTVSLERLSNMNQPSYLIPVHSFSICHPSRSWPYPSHFPFSGSSDVSLNQPVDVVTSEHVTKVGNFSFLWKLFVCHF